MLGVFWFLLPSVFFFFTLYGNYWILQDINLRKGHAFCFLPLPVGTGLSVHVNGYFEVLSNRRDIWYGADMDRGGKLRADWNRLLLEDAVAPLFRELLLALRTLSDSTILVYMRNPRVFSWNKLTMLSTALLFCIQRSRSAWISLADALLSQEAIILVKLLCFRGSV